MVSILNSERTPWDILGRDTGRALQSVLPQIIQQQNNRSQLQQSLDAIKGLSSNPDASGLDIALAAMKAGAGIPGSEKYLGMLIPELMKFAQARKSQEVPLPGETSAPVNEAQIQAPRQREALDQIERQVAPSFGGEKFQQQNKFFPTNQPPQGGTGNVAQTATTGQKVPYRTRAEKIRDAKVYAKESTDANIPMTVKEGLKAIEEEEVDKRIHNAEVDKELSQRVIAQKEYGERAAKELVKVYPEATSEQQAIFQKRGEEIANSSKGKSEADINRHLAKEADKFKSAIVNVQKSVSAPRLSNMIQRAAQGTYKDLEKAGEDMRRHLKPILDLGLYDTARSLLQDKGYGAEERESIINPMSAQSNIMLNRIPNVKTARSIEKSGGGPGLGLALKRDPINLNNVKLGLADLKNSNPNFSLLLARKAFEDKGYDWRAFKDALNEMEKEGFTLSDDQQAQRGYLDTPPLNKLEEILHGLNFIGR